MDTRTVLLISRGTMSGGRLIGDCLARHEGIRCVTREDLLATVNTFGELASRVTAEVEKAAQAYDEFSQLRRPYRILMKRALLQHAREGCLAYFGYTGHLLLDRVRHLVRVRLIASTEYRVAMTQQHLGYSETESREYIHRVDQERIRWARWMYGLDIRDPELYDLCLNLDRLSMEGACRLLRDAMLHPDFQPTPESIAQVENDYIATQVLAALATDARTLQLEFSATLAEGVLRLVGPYLEQAQSRAARSIAESVPGVARVEYEPGYAPVFF